MISRLAFAGALAAAALAAPAFAQGEHDGSTAVRDNDTRVIVMTDRHHAEGEADDQLRPGRRFRVYGGNGAEMIDCGGDRHVTERSSPDGHERTKVVICGNTQLSAEARSERLEHVLERIQHMDGLSDASKERVTAALRGAIEELRNTH